MYYFAYGMNTNISSMSERCPDAIDLGAVTLHGYSLAFKHHCDVEETPKESMQGVLWEITDKCLEELDILEGYGVYYDRKLVPVEHHKLGTVNALVYHMLNRSVHSYPNDVYYAMVMDGYLDHDISLKQLHKAISKI